MHIVMRLDILSDDGWVDQTYNDLLENWGPTVTIVDFGYDSNGENSIGYDRNEDWAMGDTYDWQE